MGLHTPSPSDRRALLVGARGVLAVSLVAFGVLSTPAAVAAGSLTCDYNPSNHTVTVNMTGDYGTRIQRTGLGRIKVGGSWCDGATVKNTDLIVVSGDGGNQTLNLSLANGGFKPGWTNEAGRSDEIEFTVNLGGGSQDQLVIEGGGGNDWVSFGIVHVFGVTVQLVNLNFGPEREALHGRDADVTALGVEGFSAFGNGGDDNITGQRCTDNICGTGATFDLGLTLFGSAGNDLLVGGDGNDRIYAGTGSDWVLGHNGDDYLDVRDGAGTDTVSGQAGSDTCLFDAGDYVTDC